MKRRSSQLDDIIAVRCRSAIDNISIDSSRNVRSILDDALEFNNMASDDKLVYREREVKHYMVNHIRHSATSYEIVLKTIHRVSAPQDFQTRELNYHMYKNAILERISQAYPFLKSECDAQKYKINMVKIKRKSKKR